MSPDPWSVWMVTDGVYGKTALGQDASALCVRHSDEPNKWRAVLVARKPNSSREVEILAERDCETEEEAQSHMNSFALDLTDDDDFDEGYYP